MIDRNIEEKIIQVSSGIPVIIITGPRQSGKTTLTRKIFPSYRYVNLEFPDERDFAVSDPRSLLKDIEKGIIIDEIQRVPQLLFYIQGITDEKKINGKVILTGSQNLNLLQSVSQSLAGRSIIFTLLPFSINELFKPGLLLDAPEHVVFNGFYPRIYDQNLKPTDLLPSYIQTYIERDVRQLINIKDFDKFRLFLRLCAGRIGQLINYQSLSIEVGVDAKTVKNWISILELSYIIFLIPPYFRNFGKRLVKTPKLYFYDTGLICSLLGITDYEQIFTHYLKGSLFENMIIADIKKNLFNMGLYHELYFWRDNTGNEIDCVYEAGNKIKIIEIKSTHTFEKRLIKNLNWFKEISSELKTQSYLVLGGDYENMINDIVITGWKNTGSIFLSE